MMAKTSRVSCRCGPGRMKSTRISDGKKFSCHWCRKLLVTGDQAHLCAPCRLVSCSDCYDKGNPNSTAKIARGMSSHPYAVSAARPSSVQGMTMTSPPKLSTATNTYPTKQRVCCHCDSNQMNPMKLGGGVRLSCNWCKKQLSAGNGAFVCFRCDITACNDCYVQDHPSAERQLCKDGVHPSPKRGFVTNDERTNETAKCDAWLAKNANKNHPIKCVLIYTGLFTVALPLIIVLFCSYKCAAGICSDDCCYEKYKIIDTDEHGNKTKVHRKIRRE